MDNSSPSPSMCSKNTQLEGIPCTELKGIGPALAQKLAQADITHLQDLLFHLPFRYQDRTHITPIRDLRPNEHAVVEGEIIKKTLLNRQKRMLICRIKDASGTLDIRFFHFYPNQVEQLQVGKQMRCFGEARQYGRQLEIVHPEYQVFTAGETIPVEEYLTPIYHKVAELQQRRLSKLIEQVLQRLNADIQLTEYLPEPLCEQFELMPLSEALAYVHRPTAEADIQALNDFQHPAQQRLAFEELLAQQLSLRRVRRQVRKQTAPILKPDAALQRQLLGQLPFSLTKAQTRVLQDINDDLKQSQPMLRLLQGDVGSGKTIVSALACLAAVEAGYQAAVMAPTELLAEQHYQTFFKWLTPLNINITWLTGQLGAVARREALSQIETGVAHIIVGTHALFQQSVHFKRLGFIAVDEQHRFGVHQRLALFEKGEQSHGDVAHQLIMTATPIPRTLAMTVYADLDTSVIDELPPGRQPVQTVAIPNGRRGEVIDKIKQACSEARQVYWVCTLIEESEQLQCQAAEKTAVDLQEALTEHRIGLVHGRMKSDEKQAVMFAFKAGEIDILVATTVIEVGVDVPNASLMIIENPERLGLAQLHQLRGRVGRGQTRSFCVLLYQAPLTNMARERLSVLRDSHDGFEIAQKDLQLRGPGELLGTRQTGLLRFRIADVQRDSALVPRVCLAVHQLEKDYPDAIEPLIKRWLAAGEQYGQV